MCIRDRHNIDVFSIEEDDSNSAFINYLHITNGAINQAFTFEYKKQLNEYKEELLTLGIIEMRERYKSRSREIIVPFEMCIRDRIRQYSFLIFYLNAIYYHIHFFFIHINNATVR